MAKDICDIKKKLADDIKFQNDIKAKHIQDTVLKFADIAEEKTKPLLDYLEKKFTRPDITEKELIDAMEDVWGKKEEQLKLAIILQGMLANNEIYFQWAKEYITDHYPEALKSIGGGDFKVDLDLIPQSGLNNMLLVLHSWAHAGNGRTLGTGIVGKWLFSITLPKKAALKESSGAFYLTVKAVEGYPYKMMSRIQDFLKKPKLLKTDRKFGWEDIIHNIEVASEYYEGNRVDNQQKLVRLFIWSLKGDTFNNTLLRFNEELGDFEVATEYFPSGKKYVDPRTGEQGTDDIYMFGNYVPLKDFQDGKFYIDLNIKKVQKIFEAERTRFRKLDDELFKYTELATKQSIQAIESAFSKVFGLTGKHLHFALYRNYPPGLSKKNKKAFEDEVKSLAGDKWDMAIKIRNSVKGLAVINPYWSDVNLPSKKKRNHFPSIYSPIRLPNIFENIIKDILDDIEKQIDPALEVFKAEGIVNQEQKQLKARKIDALNTADKLTEMLNAMDEMTVDYQAEGENVPFIKHQVHMKRMSNIINPIHMRSDRASYQAALRRTMSTIERNFLIATMIEQLGRAQSGTIQDMIINYVKVPFAMTDVKANLGPIKLGTEDFVLSLRKIGIRISPQVAQEWFRIASSVLSGQYLSGIGTTIQNWTAQQQNIINWGPEAFMDARDTLKEDPEGWKKFIRD